MGKAELHLTAAAVGGWFQYRCERKFIYECLPKKRRNKLEIVEAPPRMVLPASGLRYEEAVVHALEAEHSVLKPTVRQSLGEEESTRFLTGRSGARFAHQILLGESPSARTLLRLPEQVAIANCRVDLLERFEADGRIRFRVIDVKLSRFPTLAHRIQVAFYSLLLEAHLNDLGYGRDEFDVEGQIWHRPEGSEADLYVIDRFAVRPYEGAVVDFLRRALGRFAQRSLGSSDDTRFHIYFKCEQCSFLTGCATAIDLSLPAGDRDLSAVPGMSHQAKAGLKAMGLVTVGHLASGQGVLKGERTGSWVLRTRGARLVRRAKALLSQEVSLLAEARTLLAPASEDVAVYLLFDRDPIAGRLCSAACRIIDDNTETTRIRLMSSAAQEVEGLQEVLGFVLQTMRSVHARNESGARLTLHIYAYEPSELGDLKNAFQRHLSEPSIRDALVALVRMFPPDELVPAAEYREWQRLPGCPVRALVDQVLAVPAQVSYDLARVSQGLLNTPAPIETAYRPKPQFARPFSSRFSPDIAAGITAGTLPVAELEQDIEARLSATHAIVRWLQDRNRDLDHGDRFLRLIKRPFRLAPEVGAAGADVELLRVHTLLGLHSERLATLYGLARSAAERRERMICFAGLQLIDDAEERDGSHSLSLRGTSENRNVELSPGTIGLVLTDGDHDVLLDPARWDDFTVRMTRIEWAGGECLIGIQADPRTYASAVFQALLEPGRTLCLDKIHFDLNPRRQLRFLEFLGAAG